MREDKMTPETMRDQERPSLYDRLGGVYNIATVVDDLIDRVMTDPRLNANPRVVRRPIPVGRWAILIATS
jgi:hypothetical protein